VTDKSLIYTAGLLHKKPEFNNISLNFHSCHQITDRGFNEIAESLKKQRALESLTLVFERYTETQIKPFLNVFCVVVLRFPMPVLGRLMKLSKSSGISNILTSILVGKILERTLYLILSLALSRFRTSSLKSSLKVQTVLRALLKQSSLFSICISLMLFICQHTPLAAPWYATKAWYVSAKA